MSDTATPLVRRMARSLRWRLGLPMVAAELEDGTDRGIAAFYSGRVTDCSFLADTQHYEYPRVQWVLSHVTGGRLLEVGAGNGGMTHLLAPVVDSIVAVDVSRPSVEALRARGLPHVTVVEGLVEQYHSADRFDWIVMAEVIEHLREPGRVVHDLARRLAPNGTLIVTTPNGWWESNEHLHQFNIASFCAVLAEADEADAIHVECLRDRAGRRRWLGGLVQAQGHLQRTDEMSGEA